MLWLLTQHILVVTFLVLIVCAVCRLTRLSPAAQYVLWLVVAVKLMTPPIVTWPWSIEDVAVAAFPARPKIAEMSPSPDALHTDSRESRAESTGKLDESAEPLVSSSGVSTTNRHSSDALAEQAAPPAETSAVMNQAGASNGAHGDTALAVWRSEWLARAVYGGWLIGSFVVGIICWIRILRIHRFVSQGEDAPQWLRDEADAIAGHLGVRRPRMIVSHRVTAPFIWCVWVLSLVWPRSLTDRDQADRIRGIVAHELAHVRRRDHWGIWLDVAMRIVWWWNPLGWLVRRRLRECSELACDEWVVRLFPNERRTYAESLVEVYEQASAHAVPIPAIGARTGSVRAFQRRLTMIMSDHGRGKMTARMWLTFSAILLFALPGFSWENDKQTTCAESSEVAKPADQGATAPEKQPETDTPNVSQTSPTTGEATSRERPQPGTTSSPEPSDDAKSRRAKIDEDVIKEILGRIERLHFQEIDQQELLAAAIDGMLERLGGNSAYLRPEELRALFDVIDETPVGVGVVVVNENGRLIVVHSPPESPAAKAGVREGDVLERIDDVVVSDLIEEGRLINARKLLQVKPGETVTLGVRHKNSNRLELIRVPSAATIDTVHGHCRASGGECQFMLDKEDKIGYARISRFGKTTVQELGDALRTLRSHDVKGLVLDLRNCPGGLFHSAVEIADFFVDEGIIVTSTGCTNTGERVEQQKAHKRKTQFRPPMAVLVNGHTASAAEILAASLQDHGRATIIGQRTCGRGTVSGIFPLDSGSGALRLATTSFLRPNGKSIQRFAGEDDSGDWGVQPDTGFAVASSDDEHGRERQLARSLACVRGQLKTDHDRDPTDGQKTKSADSATADSIWQRFGMRLEEIKLEDFRRIGSRYRGGMKVVAVRPEGPTAGQDIRKGDILVGIHAWETVNEDNLNFILASDVVRENKLVKFYILRDEEALYGQFRPAR